MNCSMGSMGFASPFILFICRGEDKVISHVSASAEDGKLGTEKRDHDGATRVTKKALHQKCAFCYSGYFGSKNILTTSRFQMQID